MNMDKFIKVMMLTQSDSDGEALVAIRTANSMLKRDGKNWEEFISIKLPKPTDYSRTDQIQLHLQMIEAILKVVHGPAKDFILSIKFQAIKKGSLSPKQKAAIKKFYDNL